MPEIEFTTPTTRAKPYTWRDWREAHQGQTLLAVRLGYWHELKRWPVPGRVFQWHGWLPDLWYYAKCRAWRRYHVTVARTAAPTYHDPREHLLHVMFAVLEGLIFKERIFEHTAAEGDPADGKSWAWGLSEMQALWHWWTVDRPAREAEYDRRLSAWSTLHDRDRTGYASAHPDWQRTDNPHLVRYSLPAEFVEPEDTQAAWAALREIDDEVRDAEDDAMLIRLVKIRHYLWT